MHRFFGYGSLVNTATHDYGAVQIEQVSGWRRIWRHTAHHEVAFLTVERANGVVLDGLSAEVPGGDWAALDAREAGYLREATPEGPEIYHIPEGLHQAPDVARPILLSYLDVVVQGYLHHFGETGVERFFETTHGWEAPITNDRIAPRYPRAQVLSPAETALVDKWLRRMRAA